MALYIFAFVDTLITINELYFWFKVSVALVTLFCGKLYRTQNLPFSLFFCMNIVFKDLHCLSFLWLLGPSGHAHQTSWRQLWGWQSQGPLDLGKAGLPWWRAAFCLLHPPWLRSSKASAPAVQLFCPLLGTRQPGEAELTLTGVCEVSESCLHRRGPVGSSPLGAVHLVSRLPSYAAWMVGKMASISRACTSSHRAWDQLLINTGSHWLKRGRKIGFGSRGERGMWVTLLPRALVFL